MTPSAARKSTFTFLFTDIEGSSPLRERLGERYFGVAATHGRLLRAACEARGGMEMSAPGDDSLFVVFPQATDAVAAAVEGQRALMEHPWPEGVAIRVRVGMHTAEAAVRDGIYDSVGINYARRICDAGHGGQILLSATTRALVERRLPEGTDLRDMAQHRFKGLEAPEHLFQILHPDLPAEFPPLRTLDSRPNNLPSQWTRFIGREQALTEVRELLAANRLLTLTGIGGSGKTRLAMHVAAEALEKFPDGVWLVELAALTAPDLVAPSVAAPLGVREAPPRPLTLTLVDALHEKTLLLLLDNCEHLLEPCADLCDALLRGCPHLCILATSREALGLTGEQTYRVPSLSLPAMGVQGFGYPGAQEPEGVAALTGRTPEHHLLQYEAIRLFVDRAALTQPAFALTTANADAVLQICRRLDGIPLAIELAAARVRALPVEKINERLDDRFRLLTGGSRTALPRQQTLRALIDWSYELLDGQERVLLRRLSVFAGGWTLEAAEAVCSGVQAFGHSGVRAVKDGIEAGDGRVQAASSGLNARTPERLNADEVLDLLTQLVDKSLALYQEQDGRYRLLETVREYGRDRLLEAAEAEAVRAQHQSWALALAEEAAAALAGPAQREWLDRLESDHDNLRAAMDGSVECGEAEGALRLGAALWRFWHVRGHPREGFDRLQAALALPAARGSTAMRARALNAAGALAHDRGDFAQAITLHEESLTIARECGEPGSVAAALNHLGNAIADRGDTAAATRYYEEALAVWQETDDTAGIAMALTNLGNVAQERGEAATATRCFEQALALRRELGDAQGIATLQNNLGYLALRQGERERARLLLEACLAGFRELGSLSNVATALSNLADVACEEGDWPRAAAQYGECLVLFGQLEHRSGIAASLEGLAVVGAARGQGSSAARLSGAAAALREATGAPLAAAERAAFDERLAATRAALPADAWDTAWREGHALAPARAIALGAEESAFFREVPG